MRRGPKELIGNKLNLRHHQPWHFGTELLQPWGKRDCCSVENVFFFGVERKSPVLTLWHFNTKQLTLGLWKPGWLGPGFVFQLRFFGLYIFLYICYRKLTFTLRLRNWPSGLRNYVGWSQMQAHLSGFLLKNHGSQWDGVGKDQRERSWLFGHWQKKLTSNLVTRKMGGSVSPPSLERLCQYEQLLVVSPFHITSLQI